MENGLPLHAKMNSFSPFWPRLHAVTWLGLGSAMLVPVVMVGGRFKLTGWVGEVGGIFAPLLNTAMETEGLDVGLDSRFMLPLSVGPDCHSGVLVSFKTSVFVSKLPRDETQDAPRHTRCDLKLSCRYTDLYFQ